MGEGRGLRGKKAHIQKFKDIGCGRVCFGRFVGSFTNKAASESGFYFLSKRTNSMVWYMG